MLAVPPLRRAAVQQRHQLLLPAPAAVARGGPAREWLRLLGARVGRRRQEAAPALTLPAHAGVHRVVPDGDVHRLLRQASLVPTPPGVWRRCSTASPWPRLGRSASPSWRCWRRSPTSRPPRPQDRPQARPFQAMGAAGCCEGCTGRSPTCFAPLSDAAPLHAGDLSNHGEDDPADASVLDLAEPVHKYRHTPTQARYTLLAAEVTI